MNSTSNLRFLLHVSDFHLTDNDNDILYAQSALKALVDKLSSENIKVNYLIHTGDIINSDDLYEKVAQEMDLPAEFLSIKEDSKELQFDKKKFGDNASVQQKQTFNSILSNLAEKRFKNAEKVFKELIDNLNIPFGSVVICSGNHDVLRLFPISDTPVICETNNNGIWNYTYPQELDHSFVLFENFLDNLGAANSQRKCGLSKPVSQCTIDNLNFLLLNTNWKNPKKQKHGYFCTRCDVVNDEISGFSTSKNYLNIVLAHKPLYEICEKARLSYQRYIQTPFMSNLRKFIDKKGIYLCGDKHTRSIVGSKFHDIPHYIAGEPLCASTNREVEYNLLEISKSELGMERKIHLSHQHAVDSIHTKWTCDIRPQDSVVSSLYELSKEYIIDKSFGIIGTSQTPSTWESICQNTHNWNDVRSQPWYTNFNKQYQTICKYRDFASNEKPLDEIDIFDFVCERLKSQVGSSYSKNALNIRGEYSSGKSTFLGIFYIYLLNQYSVGRINFIPAYFNLENDEMFTKIQNGNSYFDAVEQAFSFFSNEIQKIAIKEHQPICFIIDGLDEQDCWSYSTEDSVGRALLNVLSKYDNSWHVMSFSQHRLPCFKNTMPSRKYNDKSDIMYFNPIDVREKGSEDSRFSSFIESFLKIQESTNFSLDSSCKCKSSPPPKITDNFVEQVCVLIRNFRRLTITPGFMYDNLDYIIEHDENGLLHSNNYVSDVYNYYIDKQYEICLNKLGYNFVDYAPAMSYLFSFKGYTYEKFKSLRGDSTVNNDHTLKAIRKYYDRMYHTFLFIKKNKDAREYLIALHYNRELRYYAEHPTEAIQPNSILNEFISRNIAVLVRKLWTDTNKFLILCEIFLQREVMPACMLSMLVYCLAHLKMYAPIRDHLRKELQDYGEKHLQKIDCNDWVIEKEDSIKKLNQFINLSLKHSIEIFRLVDSNNSIQLVSALLSDTNFQNYNRQFQMLYYEDLSIKGEETRRALTPGCDLVYKGFDFHNCFYYLSVKLASSHSYPLREFDMFTLWDLICSRLMVNTFDEQLSESNLQTFFYREKFTNRANIVLENTLSIFIDYTNDPQKDATSTVFAYFENVKNILTEIIKMRNDDQCSHSCIKAKLIEFSQMQSQKLKSQ